MECKAKNGARGVATDTAQSRETFKGIRQSTARFSYHLLCNAQEPTGSKVVSKRAPKPFHLIERGGGQRFKGGVSVQKLVVLGQHAIYLRLVQHDFGYQDVVRVLGLAPWQVTPVARVPAQKRPLEQANPLTVCDLGVTDSITGFVRFAYRRHDGEAFPMA